MEVELFVPIAFFASIAFILYYYFRYRYLERQALIEKGANVEELKDILKKYPRQHTYHTANMAKWGIIFIAIGLAILIGNYFSDVVMLALIFIFPGIGLLLFYKFILTRKAEEEQ